MSTRLMITGIHGMLDNGEAALVVGAISSLKQQVPDARFYIGMINGERDSSRLQRVFPEIHGDIEVVGPLLTAGRRVPWYVRTVLLLPKYVVPYLRSDIGVHVGADGYSDEIIGGPLATLTHSYQILLGWILRKPVVACAQSIGPFKARWTRTLSRFTLNRVAFVTAREGVTQAYLAQLGVAKPVHPVADLAFLVQPVPAEQVDALMDRAGINRGQSLACLAPSQLVYRHIRGGVSADDKHDMYVRAMADVVDYLASLGLGAVLLCQTIGGKHDDSVVAREIQALAKQKPWVFDDLTPQELKGIMGRCQIMVSSKMHSAVFATSMGTPTVVIGYHPKVKGIVGEMMGQTGFIVDIRTDDFSEFERTLRARIEQCWSLREKIRGELRDRLPGVQQMALRNAALIAGLLDGRRGQPDARRVVDGIP